MSTVSRVTNEWWQVGFGERLVHNLASACRAQARLAIEAHADQHDTQTRRIRAALAAGVAVELALKAAVASTLPSLLALNGDAHSQLYLMGRGGLPGKAQSDVRTVGGMAVWRLYATLRPQAGISEEDVRAALDVRNGAAHLALVDRDELNRGLRAMALCLDRLLPELGMTPHDFWGSEFEGHAAALVKEVIDAREVRVAQARSSALAKLGRLRALGPTAFEAVVMAAIPIEQDPDDPDDVTGLQIECPVCGYAGWISGLVWRSDLHVNDDPEGGAWVDRHFLPLEFRCSVCGFAVQSEDFPIAGLPTHVRLEPDGEPWELLYEDVQTDVSFE